MSMNSTDERSNNEQPATAADLSSVAGTAMEEGRPQ